MKLNNIRKIFGYVLIITALALTKSILLNFLSMYATVQLNNAIPLWIIRLLLLISGLILIFDRLDLKKIVDFYKLTATIIFTLLALFLILNTICYAIQFSEQYLPYKHFILTKSEKSLLALYPSLNKKQVFDLLTETWSRPFEFDAYDHFREKSFKGKYLNVSENGFRLVKNQGPWPPSKNSFNIFIFGGSVVFNYSLPDDETIASCLQENLRKIFGDKICVYNFGRGYYFSSQERVLFEKLLVGGFVPNIALFLDGINEFYFRKDEPLLSEKLVRSLGDKTNLLFKSDAANVIKTFYQKFSTGCTNGPSIPLKNISNSEKEAFARMVINRYLSNKKIIESAANAFKVTPIFVWQPAPTYKYDLKYHVFARGGFGRHSFSTYGYEFADKIFRSNRGNNFLYLANLQANLKKPLYVDKTHYSRELSNLVAEEIAEFLEQKITINK